MVVGGTRIGVIKRITRSERDQIIKGLPINIHYSYKCVSEGDLGSRYNLYLFRNEDVL